MDALAIIPFILFLVVICAAIAERINIPYPLLVIVVGMLVGFIPGIPNWHPSTELVLPIFLPPFLFAAARLISWQDIKSNFLEICFLSFILVIITAISMAFALPVFAPYFSLASAFVLGAIISPTDSISATSILNKLNTKQRLVRSLEIESLFNDAVSITLYKISILMVLVGTVKLGSFNTSIALSGAGGIVIGLLLAYFTQVIINNFLRESENELPIIMGLILAYVSYLFAERMGASGVLSVVAAGLFHIRTEKNLKAQTRLAEQASWNTFIFFLNGVIFIVIGLQFPVYWQRVNTIPVHEIIYDSVIVIGLLLVLRFACLIFLASITKVLKRWALINFQSTPYSWKDVIISSSSGMRGMVSLALAIALPAEIAPGISFPDRDLIILLTIIVIVFTVVIQGLLLPFIIKGLGCIKDARATAEKTARTYRYITEQALNHVTLAQRKNTLSSSIAERIVDNYYESRLLQFNLHHKECSTNLLEAEQISREAEKCLKEIMNFERDLLFKLLSKGEITQEVYIRILRKIDQDEVGFGSFG